MARYSSTSLSHYKHEYCSNAHSLARTRQDWPAQMRKFSSFSILISIDTSPADDDCEWALQTSVNGALWSLCCYLSSCPLFKEIKIKVSMNRPATSGVRLTHDDS